MDSKIRLKIERLERKVKALEKESDKLKQTQRALRESENRWRNFLSQNVAGIWRFEYRKPMPLSLPMDEQIQWMLDQSVLVECNQIAARWYGFASPDEVVGKTFRTIFEREPENAKQRLRTWIENGYRFDNIETFIATAIDENRCFLEMNRSVIENDHIVGSWGTLVDITDRKRAEVALRESERKYRQLVESTNDWVWACDREGTHLYSNQALTSVLGFDPEEIIGKSAFAFMHPEDKGWVKKMVAQAIDQKQGWQADSIRWIHKDGGVRYVESRTEPVLDADGRLTGFTGIDRDVTARKQAEEALRESEKKYRLLVETMSDSLAMIDAKETITYVNDRACKMLGRKSDDILGRSVAYFLDAASQLPFRQEIKKGQTGGQGSYELTFKGKNGKKISTLVSPKPVFDASGAYTGSFAVITDITKYKRAERSLRESERRYRTLFESANDAILIMQDNTFIECNQKSLEIFGCTREQIIGHSPARFSPLRQPDQRDSDEKATEKITKALNGEPQVFEWRHTRFNGEEFDAEISLSVIEIESEKYIQAILRDISERKRLDKELQLMQRWVEQSVDLFFWVSEDARILYVNQAVCRAMGYTKDELRTMKVADFDLGLPEEAWPGFIQRLKEQGLHCFESRLQKKDGQVFPVEITANILNFGGKTHFFAYCRDISARIRAAKSRRKLEKQLRQAMKMEAIGTLAGGIAHDFNNILAVIMGYIEIALEYELPEEAPVRSSLKEVRKAGMRATDLVKQILAFSRQSEIEKHPVNLKMIVKETTKLLRAAIPANVDIGTSIHLEEGRILADPTQIHQVIMNLCTNSAYAMREKGGRLALELSQFSASMEDTAEFAILGPGIYLKLTISDTGHGMDNRTRAQLFDPFFTTKPKEEGTGLGLSVVHGIVKDHGGHITVESEIGKGTTFTIYFPRIASRDSVAVEKKGPVPTGTERILVVDDELSVVDSMVKMLQRLGYQVTGISSSHKALDAIRANPEKYDLVITDMTMPEMTGNILAQEISSIRDDIPIILCTGFSQEITAEYAKTIGIKDLLMKPVLRNQLAQSVRRTLDLSA